MKPRLGMILFLWIGALSGLVFIGAIDFIEDAVIQWSTYIMVALFVVVNTIFTAAIWIFTFPCPTCGKIALSHHNYCTNCGENFIQNMHVYTLETTKSYQNKQIKELDVENIIVKRMRDWLNSQ